MKQEKIQVNKKNLFDQIFFQSDNMKLTRRKVSEAMRRVCSWFNKEFSQPESLPSEYKDLNIQPPYNKAKDLWQKHF
jgi:hypothetical protein